MRLHEAQCHGEDGHWLGGVLVYYQEGQLDGWRAVGSTVGALGGDGWLGDDITGAGAADTLGGAG
jgi:hypothetical protein